LEETGGVGMVKQANASQSIVTPSTPVTEPQKLSTTVSLREVFEAGVRLEASSFNIEAHNAVAALRSSALPLIPLCGEDGLCRKPPRSLRIKRISVSADKGVPFLSSSQIISLRPKVERFLSRKLTPNLDKFLIEMWDVLISRSGTIGNVGLATATLVGKALSEDAIRLRTDDPDTAGYITAFLRSRYGRPQLTQATYGSVVTHIEPEHLTRIVIPDLHPLRRIAIGRLMRDAGELRDEANRLLDEADRLLHEQLNLPYLDSLTSSNDRFLTSTVKASQLAGRLEASFHNPVAMQAEQRLKLLPVEVTTVSNERVTREVRAITKFRKRVYVPYGGIPMFSSKQLFQVDPVDVKRLAKGAHTKDLPEIQLEEGMIAITRSGTIGRVQIIPVYMANWTASEHATRLLAASDMNPGYLYAWLASDYGIRLTTRHSYGSVILEVDREMFASIPIPFPSLAIRNEIGDLVLKANALRDEAWRKEQEAISQIESLITKVRTSQNKIDAASEVQAVKEFSYDPDARPIWEIVREIGAEIPDEEWAKVPTDLSKNFDYYQTRKDDR
jgi:type I restriction enzyme S subunit